jgi:hypothetical protein
VEEEREVLNAGRGVFVVGVAFTPGLLVKPILVIGSAPAGEVVDVDTLAGFAKGGDDFGVGDAVLEHGVDLFADSLGQLGDFTGAAAMEEEARVSNEGVES